MIKLTDEDFQFLEQTVLRLPYNDILVNGIEGIAHRLRSSYLEAYPKKQKDVKDNIEVPAK